MHHIEHFELSTPKPVALRLEHGCEIRVTAGRLWVTQHGHSHDVWLYPDDNWVLPNCNVVWLSGEPQARFQVVRAVPCARGWHRQYLGLMPYRAPWLGLQLALRSN